MPRPADLPDFESPPVAEVVLSVQFDRLTALKAAHVGLLWQLFRARFPRLEEHPPLPQAREDYEIPGAGAGELRLEATATPPLARIWFLAEDGTELIQVQPDRFIHNWRKVASGDEYPRYEQIREAFQAELQSFGSFIDREQIGSLKVNQCEITYVNHIFSGQEWEKHGELSRVLKYWSEPAMEFLPDPKDIALQVRYRMTAAGAQQAIGRLHVVLRSAWRIADQTPVYNLDLTARGSPAGPGIKEALEFIDQGRIWIVRAFADITTKRMHLLWRRKDGQPGPGNS